MRYVVSASLLLVGLGLNAQTITWLSTPGMDTNYVTVISDDGNVAGGMYWGPGYKPFAWTLAGGMVSLYTGGGVTCASPADGSFLMGTIDSSDGKYYIFKWTPDSGRVIFPGTPPNSGSCSISADGSILGGRTYDSTLSSSFGWRMVGGVITDTLRLSKPYVYIAAISGNGMVLGVDNWDDTSDVPYRWVPDSGTVIPLSTLGGSMSLPVGASYDGSIMVGYSEDTAGNLHAVIWYSDGSVMDLGTLGGSWSKAMGVSGDGSIVVGISALPDSKAKFRPKRFHGSYRPSVVGYGFAAFIWTPDSGMRDLNEVYSDILGSSVLLEAWSISRNGRFIGGIGYNAATGKINGFILDRFGVSVDERPGKRGVVFKVVGRRLVMNVRAKVYDLSGRLVGEVAPGRSWRGRPGIYFVRWEGRSRTVVLR